MTDSDLALLLVGGAVLVGLAALLGPWWPARDLSATFSPEMLDWLKMIDSTPQRRAHQLALAFLFFGSLAALWLLARKTQWLQGTSAAIAIRLRAGLRRGPLLTALVGATVLLLAPEPKRLAYGLLLVPVALLVRYMRPRILDKVAWLALALYVPLLMLPGFFIPPLLQSPPMWLEWHYDATVGIGEQLAAGMQLYGEIRHHYGLLLSMTTGLVEKHVAALSASQYYRVIQALDLAFALLAALAYWRWRPRNGLKLLAPLMLVLPFIHSQHLCLNFPNHSAWRFIGLPVIVLLLLALRHREAKRLPLALGAIAALAVLFNLETGIAFSCGILVFLVARTGPAPLPSWLRRAGWFAAGLAAVMLLTALVYRAGLGTWPIPHTLAESLGLISSFSAGFGGYPLDGDPLALLIFLHAAYVVVRGALRWRFGGLRFAGAFRMAIATTLLVWFAYYVNRPISWYLWSYLFLYGFLLADFVDYRLLRWKWADVSRLRLPLGTLALALVLMPVGASSNREAVPPSIKAMGPATHNLRIALQTAAKSGAFGAPAAPGPAEPLMPEQFRALILEKADYLKAQPDRQELLYFTVNNYFVPRLTGLYQPRLASRDVFSDTITLRQMDELVAKVLTIAPPRVLFDAPDSGVLDAPSTEYQRRFFERLRARLQPAYRPAGTEHGWLILERAGG